MAVNALTWRLLLAALLSCASEPAPAVDRLSPGVAGFCRSRRRVQEMLPPETPGYLLPIVEALLSGQTDEAACRSLGISPRTFSRRVAELLGYLNVTSRFQGGAELVRRGCRDCFCRNEGRSRP